MGEDAKKQGRKLSECKNYQKQKAKAAKVYRKIANYRKDALYKFVLELAESYDAAVVENFNFSILHTQVR